MGGASREVTRPANRDWERRIVRGALFDHYRADRRYRELLRRDLWPLWVTAVDHYTAQGWNCGEYLAYPGSPDEHCRLVELTDLGFADLENELAERGDGCLGAYMAALRRRVTDNLCLVDLASGGAPHWAAVIVHADLVMGTAWEPDLRWNEQVRWLADVDDGLIDGHWVDAFHAPDRRTVTLELMVSSSGGTWQLVPDGEPPPIVPRAIAGPLPFPFDPTRQFQQEVIAAVQQWLRERQTEIYSTAASGQDVAWRRPSSLPKWLEQTEKLYRYLFLGERSAGQTAQGAKSEGAGREILRRLAEEQLGIRLLPARGKPSSARTARRKSHKNSL